MSMLPFRRILCTTDFSDPSTESLRAAGELAKHFSAELYLVHVIEPMATMVPLEIPFDFDPRAFEAEMGRLAEERLRKLAAKEVPALVKTHLQVLHGRPADTIVKAAVAAEVDLIVISVHGTGKIRKYLWGSVAERVLRRAPCRVLAIPEAPGER
ncbi:MAG: universal stress protein [Pseudomonadota bacterium]